MLNSKSGSSRYAYHVGLIALSLLIYAQTFAFDFVALDDPEYVIRNVNVLRGVNADDVSWALTTTRMGNWHPIVWWSFQIDSQLFGSGPFGFHLTNVILHTLSVVILFAALKRFGMRPGLAAAVAVLFCVHPLNVESVAWISERKGVMSTLFWVLGMLAYGHYVRKPGLIRMVAVVGCMAAGLMSKPSLLTFPFAMVLMDLWPLRRVGLFDRSGSSATEDTIDGVLLDRSVGAEPDTIRLSKSLIEKLPLFGLSLIFFFVAMRAQRSAGAVASIESIPLAERLLQIPCAYVLYLWHAVFPANLTVAVLGPAGGIPVGVSFLAACMLLGVSVYAFVRIRRAPILFVGWFWFLGTMFPMSGIVPIGVQWMADRYTYIPNMGLFLLVCSGGFLLLYRFAIPQRRAMALGTVVTIILVIGSMIQTRHWRDSTSLMTHILRVYPDNHLAHSNLAAELIGAGDYRSALMHAEAAVCAGSTSVVTRNNLALCQAKLGQIREAILGFEEVIEIDPSFAQAHLNLGNLLRTIDVARAEACYREAIKVQGDYAEAHNNLGGLLVSRDPVEARKHFEISLRLWPENADAHANLGNSYAREGDYARAIRHYGQALELQPGHAVASQNLKVVEGMAN